jgi:hypothetical protein
MYIAGKGIETTMLQYIEAGVPERQPNYRTISEALTAGKWSLLASTTTQQVLPRAAFLTCGSPNRRAK